MSETLITVELAAAELNLHAKTILRYIRDGRLPATRIGKSYRIARSQLQAFAGLASGQSSAPLSARTTCIVDIPGLSPSQAEPIATFMQAIAMTGDSDTPPLHLETAFDPTAGTMKLITIGAPSDVAKLLEMLEMRLSSL